MFYFKFPDGNTGVLFTHYAYLYPELQAVHPALKNATVITESAVDLRDTDVPMNQVLITVVPDSEKNINDILTVVNYYDTGTTEPNK